MSGLSFGSLVDQLKPAPPICLASYSLDEAH